MRRYVTWEVGSGLIWKIFQFLSLTVKSKSAFQFHNQWSVAMKYAMQSQLKCKLTVIVFKAEANKRYFSQHSDLLIMDCKLPSLLFIKWSVTADEWLVLKVNGICHRAWKEREDVEIYWDSEKQKVRQTWPVSERLKGGNGQTFFFLSTMSHAEESC